MDRTSFWCIGPRVRFLLAAGVLTAALPGLARAYTDDFAAPLSTVWNPPRAEEPGAAVTAPVADKHALDGKVVELAFPGGTSADDAGPAFATELQTVDALGYGVYEARLRTPKISRRTGLVSAFFTYFHDGLDRDDDGIEDNAEVDVELLAAEPTVIYMTVWTDYQVDANGETFRKTTRKVDLKTGRVWQTPPGGEGSYDLVEVDPLPWTSRRFKASRAFATYRFDRESDHVEYSIDLEDGEGFRPLWTLTGVADETIPSLAAPLFFNLWHNANHWHTGLAARVPSKAVLYHVDRVTMP